MMRQAGRGRLVTRMSHTGGGVVARICAPSTNLPVGPPDGWRHAPVRFFGKGVLS